MPHTSFDDNDVFEHKRAAWDRQAAQQCEWSDPVGAAQIAAARMGDWQVRPTPGSCWRAFMKMPKRARAS